MDAIKPLVKLISTKHTDNPNASKSIEKMLERLNGKTYRQALRFELKFVLDGLTGIENEQERNATCDRLMKISLKKCHANVLVTGKGDHMTNLTLSEKQQKAFAWLFWELVKIHRTFNEQSKAEPDNHNIKIPLQGHFADKHHWFIEQGINDYQNWSVLTCARKDGKSKPEKSIPPMRLVKLNKPDEASRPFSPTGFDRLPPNLTMNPTYEAQLNRLTFTEPRPIKPELGDVIKYLLSAKDGNLCQVIDSELMSAIQFYRESKGEIDVEKLIAVHMAIGSAMLVGEEKKVFELLFPSLVKAPIDAGKQFQENPNNPRIQVPLEGDFGDQFSLFVEKSYDGEFFLSMETWEKNQTNVTSTRIELMKSGMPDQHDYALSSPPSRPLPVVPDELSIPQSKKPEIKSQVTLSRSVASPLKTPDFPRLNNPVFPAKKLTDTPGLSRIQPMQGQLNSPANQHPRAGTPLTMPVHQPESSGPIARTTVRGIHQSLLNPVEDKPK